MLQFPQHGSFLQVLFTFLFSVQGHRGEQEADGNAGAGAGDGQAQHQRPYHQGEQEDEEWMNGEIDGLICR